MKKLKWLVAVTVVYLIVAVLNILYLGIPVILIQVLWIFTSSLPMWNETVKNWLGIK